MNIFLVIVHYWDPNGGGTHQSLRPNPNPRIYALQEQLLHLRRLALCQSVLNHVDRAVYRSNDFFRNNIEINIVTDGEHHVLDLIDPSFKSCFSEVIVKPSSPKMLGFEAHKVLSSRLTDDFDLYGYLEDDLLILDPTFFSKLTWFERHMGSHALLLPQRFEYPYFPHAVDKLYIDGPISDEYLRLVVPNTGPVFKMDWLDHYIYFESPSNPHSGCFFLSRDQLQHWVSASWWQDLDVRFISPLESAATLGLAKTFQLFKTCFTHSAWFEIQHYGNSFHSLIPDKGE